MPRVPASCRTCTYAVDPTARCPAQAFNEIKPKITADGIYKEPSRFVRCPRPNHRADVAIVA